ncbi:hypothetical protein LSUE1_G003335 [Lachnellula suecica]|uniref:Heterokaryon incompatibility domain-containing protein n=1 Tax=Lachnellula suecica TaxID=602035 RepID=A0A8T9CJJ8_9HELO|nr:hypothetical protein LSUE1_G003335 [Lachnellula suecica]
MAVDSSPQVPSQYAPQLYGPGSLFTISDGTCTVCHSILSEIFLPMAEISLSGRAVVDNSLGHNSRGYIWLRHRSIFAIERAASNGCNVCAMFMQDFFVMPDKLAILRAYGSEMAREESILVREESSLPPALRGWVHMYLSFDTDPLLAPFQGESADSEQHEGWKLKLLVWGLNAPDLTHVVDMDHTGFLKINMVPSTRIRINTSSEEASTSKQVSFSNLSICKTWLDRCAHDHTECKLVDSNFTPTRLVDVPATAGNSWRFNVWPDMESAPRYAALSHCWGLHPFLTLRTSNLDIFRSELPVNSLTKTFRDAITITRSLGLKYIWIDSLCIIQNSDSDWRKEAALMSQVYSCCTVCISASSAKDGSVGCLFPESQRHATRCQIYAGHGAKRKLYDFFPQQLCFDTLFRSPLSRRAWVLQERLLPTRVIFLGARGTFWKCSSSTACEAYPSGLPSMFRTGTNFLQKESYIAHWQDILFEYCQCGLTNSDDKLIAISGLARRRQEVSGDLYYAGLWRANIELQLCWTHDVTVFPRPATRRAPSWSWAATDGPYITGYSPQLERVFYHIRVLDVELHNRHSDEQDPFGQLRGGRMGLSCQIVVPAFLDAKLNHTEAKKAGQCVLTTASGQMIVVVCRLDCLMTFSGHVLLVPVHEYFHTERDHWILYGLVLRQTGQISGEYERIGITEDWFQGVVEENLYIPEAAFKQGPDRQDFKARAGKEQSWNFDGDPGGNFGYLIDIL